MSEVTYTMLVERDRGVDEIVARAVTLPRALIIALEHDGAGKAAIVCSDVGPLRYYAIGPRPVGGDFECAAYTIVRRSGYPGLDTDRALEVFEQVLLQHPHAFWSGRVVPDEDSAGRHAGQGRDMTDTTESRRSCPVWAASTARGGQTSFRSPVRCARTASPGRRAGPGWTPQTSARSCARRATRRASSRLSPSASAAATTQKFPGGSVSSWAWFSAFDLPTAPGGTTDFILATIPTTGLHPSDVEKLKKQLDRLVDGGNTVIVVEHDMSLAADSDWIIDVGPAPATRAAASSHRGRRDDSRPRPEAEPPGIWRGSYDGSGVGANVPLRPRRWPYRRAWRRTRRIPEMGRPYRIKPLPRYRC
jgi:hypothetical protein